MDNPYSPLTPISDMARFHGRRDEIEEIMYRIVSAQPQSVSVVGPPGIGKSSLLNVLTSPDIAEEFFPPNDEYVCLLIRFAEADTHETFFQQLSALLSERYPDLLGEAMSPDYQGFTDLVETLMEQQRKLVILMDDFEIPVLSDDFPTDFFSFLRGKANNNDVAYVTCTVERLPVLFRRKKRAESPFYNIFGVVVLHAMEERDVRSIVEGPPEGTHSPLVDHLDRIYQLAGGFPVLVHCLCNRLFDLHGREGSVTEDGIEKAAAAVLEECDDYLRGCWEGLPHEERQACERLLKGERLDGLQEALRSVEEKGCLRTDPDTGRPALFPGLLANYAAKGLAR